VEGRGVVVTTFSVVKDGFVVLRVPCPNGCYTKWMDGRFDDPNGGWKGRGVWASIPLPDAAGPVAR
jgi:hypothetical protein